MPVTIEGTVYYAFPAAVVEDADGKRVPNTVAAVLASPTGAPLTVRDLAGAISGLMTNSEGTLPGFLAPQLAPVTIDMGAARLPLASLEVGNLILTVDASKTAAEASATASETSKVAAQSSAASAAAAAAPATLAYQANTPYAAGQSVLNPAGELVKRLVAGTSGAAYNPADWTAPASAIYVPLTQIKRFHVLAYGADPTGVADSVPAVRAARDAAAAAGGGVVWFDPGQYKFTAAAIDSGNNINVLVTDSNISFDCDPGTATITSTVDSVLFFWAGKANKAASIQDNFPTSATTYKINPANAYAPTITTSTAGDAGNFVPGDVVFIRTGQILNNPNNTLNREPDSELNEVLSADAATGVITLAYPLSKPYQQEYFITGTSQESSTNVTANPAVLGVAKVTDRIIRNGHLRNLILKQPTTALAPMVQHISLWGGSVIGCIALFGQGFEGARYTRDFTGAHNTLHKTGTSTIGPYLFAPSTGCNDWDILFNTISGRTEMTMHLHEGTANCRVIGNSITCMPGVSVQEVIGIQTRSYDVEVASNLIVNAGIAAPIRVQPLCVAGGKIHDNIVRGGPFTKDCRIDGVDWQVHDNIFPKGVQDLGTRTSLRGNQGPTNDIIQSFYWLFANASLITGLGSMTYSAAAASAMNLGNSDGTDTGLVILRRNLSVNDGKTITLGTGTGTKIGTGPTEKVGFLGAAPVARPAVSGSRGGNAALASLLTQLAALGLITDSSTA